MSQLRSGASVRVATSDGLVIEGRFARSDSESLVLDTAGVADARRIRLADINTLWTRGRRVGAGFGIGAVIGALVGGGGVAAFGSAISSNTHEQCNCGSAVAAVAVGGALIGGAVGAAIGSIEGWRQRWP
ncbi:MAG: hypothetical protein ABJD07_12595 [Gemmatimonadaceae bacterium]